MVRCNGLERGSGVDCHGVQLFVRVTVVAGVMPLAIDKLSLATAITVISRGLGEGAVENGLVGLVGEEVGNFILRQNIK